MTQTVHEKVIYLHAPIMTQISTPDASVQFKQTIKIILYGDHAIAKIQVT